MDAFGIRVNMSHVSVEISAFDSAPHAQFFDPLKDRHQLGTMFFAPCDKSLYSVIVERSMAAFCGGQNGQAQILK